MLREGDIDSQNVSKVKFYVLCICSLSLSSEKTRASLLQLTMKLENTAPEGSSYFKYQKQTGPVLTSSHSQDDVSV